MHDTILSLFSVPILHGHIDPPVGLVEEITSKYNDCNRGVWSSETGYSTGELGMFLHEESPILGKLVESMMPSVIEYWDKHLGYAPANVLPTASWSNIHQEGDNTGEHSHCNCLLYTSPSPRDQRGSRMAWWSW